VAHACPVSSLPRYELAEDIPAQYRNVADEHFESLANNQLLDIFLCISQNGALSLVMPSNGSSLAPVGLSTSLALLVGELDLNCSSV
jgi:hypothetical protein